MEPIIPVLAVTAAGQLKTKAWILEAYFVALLLLDSQWVVFDVNTSTAGLTRGGKRLFLAADIKNIIDRTNKEWSSQGRIAGTIALYGRAPRRR